MTPKSDIEIVREGLELADRQISIGLQKVEGVFITYSLSALSNLSKQLEAAERMSEALKEIRKQAGPKPAFEGSAFRAIIELADEAIELYQKSKESKIK